MKPRLPADLPQREWARVLYRAGFVPVRGKGSHLVLSNGVREVTVPRDVDQKGTVRHILRQAGLTASEFHRLRRRK